MFLYLAFTCCVSATKLARNPVEKPDSQLYWNLRVQGSMLERLTFFAALWVRTDHPLATAAQLGWYVSISAHYTQSCGPRGASTG